jgi:site-specific recombinase XerD
MDYLQEFLDFCQYQRGLSPNTQRGYASDLFQYFQWLNTKGIDPVSVKVRDIDSFLIWLRKEKSISIQSLNRKMYCLKSFYRWLQRIEAIEKNPLDLFQNTKQPKLLPRYLTEEQQNALLLASQNGNHRNQRNHWLGKRDYLMILLFLDTGLRVSELCTLEVRNLNLSEGALKVIGKGSNEREVVLSDRLIKAIREYLDMVSSIELNHAVGPGLPSRGVNLGAVAKEMGISRNSASGALFGNSKKRLKQLRSYVDDRIRPLPIKYLFFNQRGKPMNTRHIFRLVQGIGSRAGIPDLYPHALRHTFATNLRRKGGDLLLIKESLGHSSVSTTEIYAHLGDGEYKERLRRLVN